MKGRQKERIEAYQRVQVFLAKHPLPSPWEYGAPKEILDDVVARLTTHAVNQESGRRMSKAGTARQLALCQALREQHLRPIARIANAVLRYGPGIHKATRMPTSHMTTTRLLTLASAFRQAAAPYEDVFVRHGCPRDFLARLDAAMQELYDADLDRAGTKIKRVGARAGLMSEIVRGRQAVEMLDALIKRSFAGNDETLATWQSAKRVLGVRRTRSGVEQQSVETPTPSIAVQQSVDTPAPSIAAPPPAYPSAPAEMQSA